MPGNGINVDAGQIDFSKEFVIKTNRKTHIILLCFLSTAIAIVAALLICIPPVRGWTDMLAYELLMIIIFFAYCFTLLPGRGDFVVDAKGVTKTNIITGQKILYPWSVISEIYFNPIPTIQRSPKTVETIVLGLKSDYRKIFLKNLIIKDATILLKVLKAWHERFKENHEDETEYYQTGDIDENTAVGCGVAGLWIISFFLVPCLVFLLRDNTFSQNQLNILSHHPLSIVSITSIDNDGQEVKRFTSKTHVKSLKLPFKLNDLTNIMKIEFKDDKAEYHCFLLKRESCKWQSKDTFSITSELNISLNLNNTSCPKEKKKNKAQVQVSSCVKK